jgi:DNA-binding transcriptional LysR family regulator
VVSRSTLLDLCSDFYAECTVRSKSARRAAAAGSAAAAAPSTPPPTRLRLQTEVMAGTWEALVSGGADLAIGVGLEREVPSGVAMKELGTVTFCFAVAPHHPLASAKEPLDDAEIIRHRAVAVADSAHRLAPMTVHLLAGQDVLTVSDMDAKIAALARGVGCGFVPAAMARGAIAAGRLVVKKVQRTQPMARLGYAWRVPGGREGAARVAEPGLALGWWLERLEGATTRRALLERHGNDAPASGA